MSDDLAGRICRYVLAFYKEHGYGPTVREIIAVVGSMSTSTVVRYLDKLVEEGQLLRDPGITRGVRPVQAQSYWREAA